MLLQHGHCTKHQEDYTDRQETAEQWAVINRWHGVIPSLRKDANLVDIVRERTIPYGVLLQIFN